MSRSRGVRARALGVLLALLGSGNAAAAQGVLPRPDPAFDGVIGRTAAESTPHFPAPARAPKGAPNVLLVLTDDVGFGASSAFGGQIPTPTLDRLAAAACATRGSTPRRCARRRARRCSRDATTTRRHRHDHGVRDRLYAATTRNDAAGASARSPRCCARTDTAPRGSARTTTCRTGRRARPDRSTCGRQRLGFDYFYGFIGGDTDQWHSALYEIHAAARGARAAGDDRRTSTG